MEPDPGRYKDKLKHDLTLEGAKNLLVISRRWPSRVRVIRRLLPFLNNAQATGMYTEDIIEGRRKVGYRVRSLGGESRILAKTDLNSSVRIDRFYVDIPTIEAFINPIIEAALQKQTGILLLGHIGKIEILSTRFRELFEEALYSKLKVIATLPNYRVPFFERLRSRPNVCLVEITKENQDIWPEAIRTGFLPHQKSQAA